jgi:hypothetical protein
MGKRAFVRKPASGDPFVPVFRSIKRTYGFDAGKYDANGNEYESGAESTGSGHRR